MRIKPANLEVVQEGDDGDEHVQECGDEGGCALRTKKADDTASETSTCGDSSSDAMSDDGDACVGGS